MCTYVSICPAPAPPISLLLLPQLLIFLRAHQLLSDLNHQCVMALTPSSSPMLVTPDSCSGNSAALPTLLLERITHLMEAQLSSQQQQEGGFGGCYGCCSFPREKKSLQSHCIQVVGSDMLVRLL